MVRAPAPDGPPPGKGGAGTKIWRPARRRAGPRLIVRVEEEERGL